ncbi:MAG: sulfite exporter TauE/SafE family protein [bacterium]|nr:sulfite exporter TauE/SafE family protein [bacterium]
MDILFDLTPLAASFGSLFAGVAVCFAIGLAVGFVSALFGIGGGFVVTPFFHSVLQLSAPLAVASSMGQIAFMSLSGMIEYARQRKILYREGLLLLLGAIPASQAMAMAFGNLRGSSAADAPFIAGLSIADFFLLLCFGLFLGLLGVYNVYRSFGYSDQTEANATATATATEDANKSETRSNPNADPAAAPKTNPNANPNANPKAKAAAKADAMIAAERALRIRRRPAATLLVGCGFGALSALLGVGGGFFAVPFFVFALKFKPAEAVATSFFCILITSVLTTLHYVIAGNIYLGLSICIALGSVIGAQFGSRFAIRIAPGRLLFSLGCGQLLVTAGYVALKLL